jgi:hypothetical protein
MKRLLPILFAASVFAADEQAERLARRLAEEAEAFRRVAPRLLGRETMQQKAVKDPPRLRIRAGQAAQAPAPPEWRTRTLVSEYGFTVFADGALHELRQVVSVDGKPVKSKGPEELARIIAAPDDKRKRELLRSFQKHGLESAVTDFGQILLLFSPRGIGRYEFTFRNFERIDEFQAIVFEYRQIDGANVLTVFNAAGENQQLRMEGQVFVDADTYSPLRITLATTQRVDSRTVRHEAEVNYTRSEFGAMLPARMRHSEFWDNQPVAVHDVHYQDFKRFGAVSAMQFGGLKQ